MFKKVRFYHVKPRKPCNSYNFNDDAYNEEYYFTDINEAKEKFNELLSKKGIVCDVTIDKLSVDSKLL